MGRFFIICVLLSFTSLGESSTVWNSRLVSSLQDYSKTRDLSSRVKKAMVLASMLPSNLEDFDPSKPIVRVALNARDLHSWAIHRFIAWEQGLNLKQRYWIAAPVEGALLPLGTSAILEPSKTCGDTALHSLNRLLVNVGHHQTIAHNLRLLVLIDQASNRRTYYLRMLQLLRSYPPSTFTKAVVTFIEESLKPMIVKSESVENAKFIQKTFSLKVNVIQRLKKLGIHAPFELLKRWMIIAPNCFPLAI